jgi:hypothetical protein
MNEQGTSAFQRNMSDNMLKSGDDSKSFNFQQSCEKLVENSKQLYDRMHFILVLH